MPHVLQDWRLPLPTGLPVVNQLGLALLLFFALPAQPSSEIVLHVESFDRVESLLPVHLGLQRVDGQPVQIAGDLLHCKANGSALNCDGIDYKIARVIFEVE